MNVTTAIGRKKAASRAVKMAPDPFNKLSADTVLRSSDNVNFRVRRVILIEVSPFFEQMFSLPQPPTSTPEDPISIAEHSDVLNILLRLCYPLSDRVPEGITFEMTRAVLEAAMKYEIDVAVELMCRSMRNFAKTQPLRTYAVACILQLEPEARHAAQEVVMKGIFFGYFGCFIIPEELQTLPAGCYHRLLKFRAQVEPADDFTFVSEGAPCIIHSDTPDPNSVNSHPAPVPSLEAGPPFDRPDADVVIISRDNICFRLHTSILRIVSPAFADMLDNDSHKYTYLQMSQDDMQSYNVQYGYRFAETGSVLKTLFGLSYFQDPPKVLLDDGKPIPIIVAVVQAASKYRMLHVLQIVKTTLIHTNGGVALGPFRTYLLATLFEWTAEANAAAAQTLAYNFAELQAMYEPELEQITTNQYKRLLSYHSACGRHASMALDRYSFCGDSGLKVAQDWKNISCETCPVYPLRDQGATARIWYTFVHTASVALKVKPHPSVPFEGAARQKFLGLYTIGCDHCRKERHEVVEALAAAIKADVGAVACDPVIQRFLQSPY